MRFFAAAIIATFAYGIKLQEAATLEEIDEALDLVGATEEERAVLEAKYESLDDDEKAGFREAMGDLRDAHEAGEIDDDDVMDVVGKLRSGELDLDDIEDGVKEHLKKKKQGGDKKKKGGDESGDEAAEEAAPVEFAQEDVTVEDVEAGLDELGATDEEKAALKEKFDSLDDDEKEGLKEALTDLKAGLESGEISADDVKKVVKKLRKGEIDLDDVEEGVRKHLEGKDGKSDDELELAQRV